MKSRYTQRQFEFDQNEINTLCKEFGFDEKSDFLLKKFTVHSDNADEFFCNGENCLLDAFLMPNMHLAVDKLNRAIQQNKKILIFGDYDADGISAAAILKLFFDEQGVDSFVYLPKRSEGYGLKIETLMRLHREFKFDLVVTVDCGITAVDEVEFVKKILHADIIVTDHHEPAEKLPACVCLNPKLGYPFKDLSGSGVALKLVQAMSSVEVAKTYCDLASIGTIADIMPMESENRVIVKIACRHINNVGLKALLQANKVEENKVDCNAMAMKICPKINAAGRVDEPSVALDLLLATTTDMAQQKVKALIEANMQRQSLTEKAYAEALEYIKNHDLASQPAIFVYGTDWKHGILGLVASRLVEKYKVPVGAFMPDGDNIIGSMRTPEGINLYATVSELKQHVIRFGGHKMSVGVTLFKDDFELFYRQFLSKIAQIKSDSAERYFDVEFCNEFLSDKFINQMKSFEPIAPNNKVVFYGKFSAKSSSLFGKSRNYLKILTQEGFELKTFADYTNLLPALKTNCNFECLFTLDFDEFSHKYVGLISDMNIINSISFDDLYLCNYIKRITFGQKENIHDVEVLNSNQVRAFAQEGGCCCVFGSMLEFEEVSKTINFDDFYLNFFYPGQVENTVLISPDKTVDLSKFQSVIHFDSYSRSIEVIDAGENTYYCDVKKIPTYISGQNFDRNGCVKIFKAILSNLQPCIDSFDLYLKCGVFEYTFGTFLYVLKIFEELKIFNIIEKPFTVIYNKGIKVNLADSQLYNMIVTK